MNALRDSSRDPNRDAGGAGDQAIMSEMAVPPMDSLCAFTASIDPTDLRDPSARSDFHWQTFKCRLLVFSLPVLACPVRMPGAGLRDFTVICRREDLDGDVRDAEQGDGAATPLRTKLAALKLALSRVRRVSAPEYAACLEYTLAARVAPLWNPVAEHLVQGKDFLTAGRLQDAVRLRVNVFGEKGAAWLSIYPCRMRLAALAMSDMDVSSRTLDRFQDNPLGEVPATCIGRPWIHVLPSLKRGMVMSISRTVPAECPFQRYRDFRRHWKNMVSSVVLCCFQYGYRLPEECEDLPYVSVYFELLGKPMCYPWRCLTPRLPVKLRSLDPAAVATAFLGAVASSMPTVCGYPAPLTLDGGLVVAEAALLPVNRADAQANLRPAPTASQDRVPLSCPLSIATQRDGARPHVEWNVPSTPRRARPEEGNEADKENRPPSQARPPQRPLQRPVFRSRPAVAAPRPAPVGAMTWFRPRCASSPGGPAAAPGAAAPGGLRPPSPGGGSGATGSPASSSRTSERGSSPGPSTATGVVPSFRVPVHKPIFLSKFTPSAPASKAKHSGRAATAAPRLNTSGNTSGPRGPAQPTSGTSASATAARKTPGVKRPASEPLAVPELRTADACRRASIPVLLAWLRSQGVACRAKDKKAELVDKAIAKVGELAPAPGTPSRS